jgi:hypothetical protein
MLVITRGYQKNEQTWQKHHVLRILKVGLSLAAFGVKIPKKR